jgi:hypothetical protein
MEDLEYRLAEIGYRSAKRGPECWQVSQIGEAEPLALQSPRLRRQDPAYSLALRLWLGRLANDEQPMPYRISKAAEG